MSKHKTVWKFVVPEIGVWTTMNVPKFAAFRHVGQQNGKVAFWAEVLVTNDLEERTFSVFGTGWDIPIKAQYWGTVQIGEFVWHLYEQPQPPPDR